MKQNKDRKLMNRNGVLAFRNSFPSLVIGKALTGLRAVAADMAKWIGRSILLSLIVFGVAYFLLPRPKPIQDATTLFVSLDRPIVETTPLDHAPFLQLILNPPKLSASMIDALIRDAAADPNITRIVISLDGMAGTRIGPARRIGDALAHARREGVEIVAYATNFNNAAYLLAAEADEILTHPMGRFDVGGVKAGAIYYGDALRRFGVDVIVGQAGKYKSAVEPYLLGAMSEDAAAALARLIDRQQTAIITDIAEKREQNLRELARALEGWESNDRSAFDAQTALELGLVDRLTDTPQFMDAAFGKPGVAEDNRYVALSRYATLKRKDRCAAALKARGERSSKGRSGLGVITIEGPIEHGFTTADHAGAASLVAQIEGYARRSHNKGLLVRIDTPGGNAQASEKIRSALARYRDLGRPVIISMGTVAASGGYWIATAGDVIFAEPTTITGSIGVYALRASIAGPLSLYGIAWDGMASGRVDPHGGFAEPADAEERAAINAEVARVYDRFTSLVADERALDLASAQDWADGRIWHATDALENQLIDRLGGFEDALDALADMSGAPAECAELARPAATPGAVLSAYSPMSRVQAEMQAVRWNLRVEHTHKLPPLFFNAFSRLTEQRGVQARCLLCELE